ncbi:hypothetical protein [Ancylobacter lacus]|uniref:hypothetical protein n=1 Tax=Ancylobacter lacus TaxID=2579970 RepID=UPI001BD1A08B|nr:hypothetical protein [Ancylobacter lacus]MBS7538255.1 hypothetical protein [Ancylobacter lacus]
MGIARFVMALVVPAVLASGPAAAAESARIPLQPRPDRSGFSNFVTVAVGGGAPGEVLLDTGSTGLRILASAVGPEVRLTDIPVTYSYTSGNVLRGVLGYARVAFPGSDPAVATEREIAIQVVQSVGCKPSKPDCPGWRGGEKGVMGVAYMPDAAFNPLAQLPAPFGNGFIVAADDLARPGLSPHLVVGLTEANLAGFSFAPFAALPDGQQPPGLKAWNTKSVRTCFSVDGGPEGCDGTVFDTGAALGSFEVPDHPVGRPVRRGALVTTRVPEAGMTLAVTAGRAPWRNRYRYAPPHGGVLGFNAGGLVFRHMEIAFDAVRGRIGFRAP